jgi:hypothetical protein
MYSSWTCTGHKCSCAFFAFDIIHLFSVVFYVVRAAHKFDFRLVMKAVPNKWWPVERKSWSDRDLRFWQDIYMYISSRPSPGVSRDSTHALQFDCVLLGVGQYLYGQAAKCVGYVAHAQSSDIGFLPRSELIHDDEAADYGSRYEIIIRWRLHILTHFVRADTLRASLSNTKIWNRLY